MKQEEGFFFSEEFKKIALFSATAVRPNGEHSRLLFRSKVMMGLRLCFVNGIIHQQNRTHTVQQVFEHSNCQSYWHLVSGISSVYDFEV